MTAAEWTALATAVIAPALTLFGLFIVNRRKTIQVTSHDLTMDSQKVVAMLQTDNNRLREELRELRKDYERQIAELKMANIAALSLAEDKWRRIHEGNKLTIGTLKDDIADLYRRQRSLPQ